MHHWSKIGCAAAVAVLLWPPTGNAALFNFETNYSNTPTPFTDTVAGLSATFTGQASVCAGAGLFNSLSGNILIQNYCGPSTESGALTMAFSADLGNVSFEFGTPGGIGTLTLQEYENATLVGTSTFLSVRPPGRFNGEGVASATGLFNRLVLSTGGPLALDNINALAVAVPEPAGMAVLGAGLVSALLTRARRRQG